MSDLVQNKDTFVTPRDSAGLKLNLSFVRAAPILFGNLQGAKDIFK